MLSKFNKKYKFDNKSSPSKDIRRIGERLHRDYGEVFAIWIGSNLNVTLTDPKSIEVSQKK